ncbi:MAG: hypothetical protein KC620_25860, partial [Myxococcales bacterium]|nr:hypothetical protein [Myxococcales bacterium]
MSRLSCIFGLLLCACTAETGDAIVDHHPPYVEPETPDDLPPPGSALPPLTRAPIAPPAISGGHVAIVGRRVVVGDPDRERALVFDLDADRLIAELPLAGEPGRVVAGESGLVFVALRDGGAVAVIDPATATLQTRYPVCPSPRGLAEAGGQLHVACLGGALITFAALTGDEMARVWLPPDLRDVVLVGEQRWVSRFRSAEVLIVAPNGRIEATLTPPPRAVDGQYQVPHVAWRLRPRPGGGVTLLHQLAGHAKVDIRRSGG